MQNSTQQIVMQILLLRISFQDPVPWLNSGLSPDSPDDAFVSWKADPPLCVCIPLPFTTLLWELFPKLRPNQGHYPAKKKICYEAVYPQTLSLTLKTFGYWIINMIPALDLFFLPSLSLSVSGKFLFHSRPCSHVFSLALLCPAPLPMCLISAFNVMWWLLIRISVHQTFSYWRARCHLPTFVSQAISTVTGRS